MTTGTCLCGKIIFEVNDDITEATVCHCSICRKATGSAYGAYGGVPSENLIWTQGKDQLNEFKVTEVLKKYFCNTCGSTLITRHQSWPDYAFFSLGCLDGDLKVSIKYHQFVASKANWVKICGDTKQFDEWPDEYE